MTKLRSVSPYGVRTVESSRASRRPAAKSGYLASERSIDRHHVIVEIRRRRLKSASGREAPQAAVNLDGVTHREITLCLDVVLLSPAQIEQVALHVRGSPPPSGPESFPGWIALSARTFSSTCRISRSSSPMFSALRW